jgi:SAM-dependent methyltransferase
MTGGGHGNKGADSVPALAAFYDDLARSYHRLYRDWDAAINEQAQALDLLLRGRLGEGSHRILDCAVGIGTQMLGLLQLGHQMYGTDISVGAVERAGSECHQRGLEAGLGAADMRMLPFRADSFDAVICADNAIAHLLSIPDAVRVFHEMARVTRPGGVIIASVRDYEAARRTRPPGTLPQVNQTSGEETIAFQVWDWLADGRRYNLKHFSLTTRGGTWQVTTRSSTLYAFTEAELVECAQQAGLQDIEWRAPAGTGFFQPVIVGSVMP